MHKLLRCVFFALATTICFASAPDEFSAEDKQLLVDSFETVWKIVRVAHYDPTLGGLDWQAIHEQYAPRIAEAASMDDGRDIMNEMLGLLKQSHIRVLPASAYDDRQVQKAGDYTPGLEIRILDSLAIVTGVEANSPAAKAGVRPGWQILKIDGKPVDELIKRNEEHYSGSTLKDIYGSRAVESLLAGSSSEAAEIEFSDGKNLKSLKLDRVEPRGTRVTFATMPPIYFWVETSTTDDDIRIIKFNVWLEPDAVANAFSEIMKNTKDAKGFIIDLRDNPGGLGGMAMGAAGWFTDQKGLKLGSLFTRATTLKFVVSPRPRATNAPLAILVDGSSASTTEVFAGGMQDLKRARIFGSRTAGAALPSNFVRLPNGDGFQYIVANYISEGGKPLEGLGVTPDECIHLTQKALLAGKDPVLDGAIAWIKSVGLDKSDNQQEQ
jgi:carboxyl-terminal processing protease